MRVGIHQAKTNLSRLIPAVQTGEDIIITKAGKPVARLVPFIEKTGPRLIGLYCGKIKLHGDLLASLPLEIIDDFWPEQKGA